MPDRRIVDQDVAARRGLLLGMTLAGVMLIVLFCLLLLLGKVYMDWRGAGGPEAAAIIESVNEDREPGESTTDTLDRIKRKAKETSVIEAAAPDNTPEDLATVLGGVREKGTPSETITDTWRRLTDNLDKVQILENQLGDLKARENELQAKTTQAEQDQYALIKEIAKLKAGSPPPCLHKRPSEGQALRGESIALGVLHIETDRMTLVAKNRDIAALRPVDFVGKEARYEEAVEVLESWAQGEPLGLEDFRTVASNFVRIGNDESDGKLRCRFTMDYCIRDGVPYDIFVDEFLKFFYMQRKLNKAQCSQYEQ